MSAGTHHVGPQDLAFVPVQSPAQRFALCTSRLRELISDVQRPTGLVQFLTAVVERFLRPQAGLEGGVAFLPRRLASIGRQRTGGHEPFLSCESAPVAGRVAGRPICRYKPGPSRIRGLCHPEPVASACVVVPGPPWSPRQRSGCLGKNQNQPNDTLKRSRPGMNPGPFVFCPTH